MINKLSPLPEFLVRGYKKWKSSAYLENEKKFKELASFGQNPKAMIISCCDSRVHATSIFGANEGYFFIHRNIANLVPSYSADFVNYGTTAALEYAIKGLKIQHLIILGHRNCGGIKHGHKMHSSILNPDYEYLNKWLSMLLPAFNNIKKNTEEKEQIDQLEKESIKVSVKNLYSFPFVKKAVKDKKLSIHGLIHDIGSGDLKFLNPLTDEFENL